MRPSPRLSFISGLVLGISSTLLMVYVVVQHLLLAPHGTDLANGAERTPTPLPAPSLSPKVNLALVSGKLNLLSLLRLDATDPSQAKRNETSTSESSLILYREQSKLSGVGINLEPLAGIKAEKYSSKIYGEVVEHRRQFEYDSWGNLISPSCSIDEMILRLSETAAHLPFVERIANHVSTESISILRKKTTPWEQESIPVFVRHIHRRMLSPSSKVQRVFDSQQADDFTHSIVRWLDGFTSQFPATAYEARVVTPESGEDLDSVFPVVINSSALRLVGAGWDSRFGPLPLDVAIVRHKPRKSWVDEPTVDLLKPERPPLPTMFHDILYGQPFFSGLFDDLINTSSPLNSKSTKPRVEAIASSSKASSIFSATQSEELLAKLLYALPWLSKAHESAPIMETTSPANLESKHHP